ncbi:MAG: putative lipoprotein [bacterium ADurb.Bin270]|nr:hypothetical protein [Myxococcales bacterium]OQA62257.1 MAG: putative lipoprotein [bacterium ADurb.Bin270]HQG13825.1 YajG family lipoprotein [bacterium]HQH80350.1 YajG family lipoprotein [bacterium]
MLKQASFLVLILLFLSASASAQDTTAASITLTSPDAAKIASLCESQQFKGKKLYWKGVIDGRTEKSVGVQDQKGKESIKVYADPEISAVLSDSLAGLFRTCGMELMKKPEEEGNSLSATLHEFFVDVDKKLMSGISASKASITFSMDRSGIAQSITLGTEIDSKGVRSRKLKQLQKSADLLLMELIEAIAESDDLKKM